MIVLVKVVLKGIFVDGWRLDNLIRINIDSQVKSCLSNDGVEPIYRKRGGAQSALPDFQIFFLTKYNIQATEVKLCDFS